MRNKGFETNVINLKKKRLARRCKALFGMLTSVKMFFIHKFSKPSIRKNYKKTINH
jgi:hypothetical protein